jgi:DNA-directed RNA polymerase subunit RPC12/RpoP
MIDTFLETNYISPEIKKFTEKHLRPEILKKDYKCTRCKKIFYYDDLHSIKYAESKQIYVCKSCLEKRKRRH